MPSLSNPQSSLPRRAASRAGQAPRPPHRRALLHGGSPARARRAHSSHSQASLVATAVAAGWYPGSCLTATPAGKCRSCHRPDCQAGPPRPSCVLPVPPSSCVEAPPAPLAQLPGRAPGERGHLARPEEPGFVLNRQYRRADAGLGSGAHREAIMSHGQVLGLQNRPSPAASQPQNLCRMLGPAPGEDSATGPHPRPRSHRVTTGAALPCSLLNRPRGRKPSQLPTEQLCHRASSLSPWASLSPSAKWIHSPCRVA